MAFSWIPALEFIRGSGCGGKEHFPPFDHSGVGGPSVKAPAFAYARPRSLAEAFGLLEKHGDAARVLAGGQRLVALLNLRLAAPEILVDITAISGMSGISISDGT